MSLHARRRLVAVALVGAVVVAALVFRSSGSEQFPHRVYATVPDANNMIAGQDVRLGGAKVGKIGNVKVLDGGRRARVALDLGPEAWPLRRSAKLQLRWGGTVNFSNRYLALELGDRNAPELGDGATLPAKAIDVPVEYDQLVKAFTPDVRADLRRMLDNGGPALDAADRPLRLTLSRTPPALKDLSATVGQIVEDPDRLDLIVRAAERTVSAVDAADPGLRELLTSAASTLSATGAQARDVRAALDAAPTTFTGVRDTLKRADPTLTSVGRLAKRLEPGVRELKAITPPLDRTLATVIDVGPDATSSLATARRATSTLNPLLRKATSLMPDLESLGKQAAEELTCLRPYTPDAVAFFTNWGDFISSTDNRDHYFRAYPQVLLPASTNTQEMNSAQAAKAFPGLRYAFPRPPGSNAGKPWFQPECGVTKDAYDPAKDPEAR